MKFERQLVSTIANNPELLTSVSVQPDQFEDKVAGKIFQAVINLISDKKIPDIIMLSETLNFEHEGEWMREVADVLGHPAIPANLKSYEDLILTNNKSRQLALIGSTLTTNSNSESAMSDAITSLRALDQQGTSEISHIGGAALAVIQQAEDLQNNLVDPPLQTGIYELDRLSGGIRGGESIVVAARTSVGKTAFMCNLAVNFNAPVGIISGEQGKNQIAQRLLARIGGVSAYRIRNGKLDKHEWPKLIEAGRQLEEKPIYIVDKSRPSIEYIEQQGRKLKWDHDIQALCIDYLQLITNNKYPEKRIQVSDISQRIKALAQELDIPVIILAQLNRGAEGRKPLLSDLKESGSIEEDADMVVLLSKDDAEPGMLTVDLQKARDGATGYFNVGWDGEYMRIRNLDNNYGY